LTSEQDALDPGYFLVHQPLTLYRLSRAIYANLSGIGAARDPGRWNRPGEEAIYTSTEMGVPILETLAHTRKDSIPSNLALMKIRITGSWESHKNALIDPKTSSCFYFYRSIGDARKAFQSASHMFASGINPFAVAIPSVIVPVWNVVLFPLGEGFWDHVSLESVEPFQFDPRLFPEDTPGKPARGEPQN
jgi:RES domain-containing protein